MNLINGLMNSMQSRLLHDIENLNPAKLSADSLADHAYALDCCRFPASINGDEFHQSITRLCDRKIGEVLREYVSRLGKDRDDELKGSDNARSCFDKACRYFGLKGKSGKRILESFRRLLSNLDYSGLSSSELVMLHALNPLWHELRRQNGMEPLTRIYFWRIAKAMGDTGLAKIFLLAECLEAGNHARNINLAYRTGDQPAVCDLSSYADDEALIGRIGFLSGGQTYIGREELISIADRIQTEIIDTGRTAEHITLVNAILDTGMPCFDYPKITMGLEKAIRRFTGSNTKSRIELAPIYHTLWQQTLKPVYLNRFEKTVRHCYLTLTAGKTYRDLGIDTADSESVDKAIRFIDDNRETLWIINDRYDVDKIIRKYHAPTQVSLA